MRKKSRSPLKSSSRTPKKPLRSSNIKDLSAKSTAASIIPENSSYLCHYRNAMYMGGIKCFQKHGRGIILHDNGASIISEYYHDLRHGHNIILYENCILSMLYTKNKQSQVVMRIPSYLMYLRYSSDELIDGKGVLLDYSLRNIHYLTYRKGNLIDKKTEEEYSIINRVFDLNNVEFIIGFQHSEALKLEINKDEHINSNKSGTKLNFGFYRKGLINGLGATFSTKDNSKSYNLDTHRINDQFCIKTIERGYFVNSQLNGMGQKWFKNGNNYVGNFKNDMFEGQGILKNSLKRNWVFGYFEAGNMCELIDYSHQGDIKKMAQLVQNMHQRKNSWIDNQVEVVEPQVFRKQIQNILQNNPQSKIKTLEQKKQQVLAKIQSNFMCEDQSDNILSSSRHIYSYNNIGHDSNIQEPKSSDFRGFSQKFTEEKGENSEEMQRYNQESHDRPYNSPTQSLPHNYQTSSSRYRHSKIFQRSSNSVSRKGQSKSLLKLQQVPTTKQSSSRYRLNQTHANITSVSPMKILEQSRNRDGQVAKIVYKAHESNPNRSRYEYTNRLLANHDNHDGQKLSYRDNSNRNSGIRDQAPTFNLDSKRIISRSRLFKYLNNQSEEENPPKFTYKYANT